VPAAQRRTATAKICRALTVHAQMEEALFYPALRRAGKQKERDSVLEAAEEHGVVKDLIAKIQALPPRDETLKAKLTVLKESVEHHVREEESEIFAEARSVLGRERLAELGAEMLRFKERALRTGSAPAARRSSTRKSTAQKAAPRKKSTVRKAKRR
jgi:hemerythrin-like domain-containing protein